jgi:protein KRI1
LKTRFNYKDVNANDFGLTEEEILLLDDQKLNNLVALKKYRPYRDDED